MNKASHRILTDGTTSPGQDAVTSLRIVWGKAFDDVYCHHAALHIPFSPDSLFAPELAKISVCVRNNSIEKGQVVSYSDTKLTRFLPVHQEETYLTIPLNSKEILDALCENGWTKLKTKERGAPKSFPLSMEIEVESKPLKMISFRHEIGKYPYTLSEIHFPTFDNGERIETIIDFE